MPSPEFRYEFADKTGNELTVLQLFPPENNQPGKVTLKISEAKNPGQRDEAIAASEHLGRALSIPTEKENNNTISFNTGNEFRPDLALIISKELETRGLIGEGAEKGLKTALEQSGFLPGEQQEVSPMEAARKAAQTALGAGMRHSPEPGTYQDTGNMEAAFAAIRRTSIRDTSDPYMEPAADKAGKILPQFVDPDMYKGR